MRRFSATAVAVGIGLSILLRSAFGDKSMGWQIALALLSLAIGIPHGAVDHLITIPRTSRFRFVLFIALYVVIAIIAAIAILKWNVLGFQIVVLMSALHFGFGDASFLAESGAPKMNRLTEILYALSAGSLPVVIPLVNSKSTSALKEVNPQLVGWAQGATYSLQVTISLLTAAAVICLLFQKRYRDLVDLILLGMLAVIAPPLVAFALYFGCWHAVRHTARLTLLLPPSPTPIWSAVKAGLPALVGAVLIALGISVFNARGLTSSLLWSLLVVVWALTVPHMMTTAKFDFRSLK
jgi:Brp/Blh family beta-carotene 15,15'-monooxygenase